MTVTINARYVCYSWPLAQAILATTGAAEEAEQVAAVTCLALV